MSYNTHGSILAVTYNNLVGVINAIYDDLTPFTGNAGYGHTPVASVTQGNDVAAADWTALFATMQAIATHQGTSMGPIPSSVTAGSTITAFNNYVSSSTLKDVESALVANRLIVAPSQVTVNAGTATSFGANWAYGLQYMWQVDFGSYNNARYFFNTGGAVTFAMPNSPSTGSAFWDEFDNNAGVVKFTWDSTIPQNSQTSQIGYYGLTTSFQEILRKSPGAGVYSNNYLSVQAKLVNASGTDGKIAFQAQWIDNDGSPPATKTNSTIQIGSIVSAGTVPYPGSAMALTPGSWTANVTSATQNFTPFNTHVYTPVTVTSNLYSITTRVNGSGTATSAAISLTTVGGSGTYTYAWSNITGSPTNVTFSAASASSTTLSLALSSGQTATGTVQCVVTDTSPAAGQPAVVTFILPWAFNSNNLNL
jgi:hypothetical protein